MGMHNNILRDKADAFAKRIVKMVEYLKNKNIDKNNLSQVLRSGTSIGANIHESIFAESRLDFIHKLRIALKEAEETKYWIEVFNSNNAFTEKEYISIHQDICQIIYILIASINKTTQNGL